MFNWRKKTSIFIGRFQPFHEGHKKIFLKILKNSEQVAILVMDSHKVGIKNPLSFKSVKRKIDTSTIDIDENENLNIEDYDIEDY